MKYGYIRVSSREQNLDRQYAALAPYEIPKKNIYVDKQSGKSFDRVGYKKLVKKLKQGDTLIIKSIDRLGRNYNEILEQWKNLTRDIKVDIVVIDMPLLNTNLNNLDLMGTFISDLVLQILAYVAQTEREFIKQRQAEGIAVAKAKGVHFGCKPLEMSEEFDKYYFLWKDGKISTRQAANKLGISHSTFYRRCKEIDKK